MWWYLTGLIWIAFVVGITWSYKNKKAKRDAAREQEFGQLFSELKRGAAALPTAPAVGAAITAAVPAAVPIQFTKKSRLLAPNNVLIYYVLRAGLPDHEIFVNVSVGDLIVASTQGYQAEQKMKRLAIARADFVICTKQMEIIAAVLVSGSAAAAETNLIEECLHSAGIRLVRIDPAAVPKHTQVRALIYGSQAGTTTKSA